MSTSALTNPFQPTKFEWEKRPVIWLSSRARKLITTIKPVYISGSRGSGKTTILRSLSTRQLSSDPFLRSQVGKSKLPWFGQYLQFNNTLQQKTDKLAEILSDESPSKDELVFKLFHAYFELTLLYYFLNDLIHFQDEGFLHFNARDEKSACSELSDLLASSRWAQGKSIANFQDARRLLREIQQEFLKTPGSIDVEGLKEIINAFQPGALVKFVKEKALPAIHSSEFVKGREIDFFILLDDCENLSDRQQIALNSYIRMTEGVAKWVVSFLTDRFNTTQTYLKDTTLNDDDRTPLPLNDLSESDFVELCEQVATLRLNRFVEGLRLTNLPPLPNFKLPAAFGAFSYNTLIGEVIEQSESKKVLSFINDVVTTKGVIIKHVKKSLHERFSCDGDRRPYIEHIVINALGLQISDYSTPEHQQSLLKTIDGKQAAAYIAFCDQFNLRPMFAGSKFITAISHNCIRDYLDVMARVFDVLATAGYRGTAIEAHKVARRFFPTDGHIGSRTQSNAINEVSSAKVRGLEELKLSEPHVRRLVLGLCHVQQTLEHDHEEGRSIKLPVRGKFRVDIHDYDFSARTGDFDFRGLRVALERIEYDRYIRILKTTATAKGVQIVFTLHRRLRPHFRCGLTGPYDPSLPLLPTSLLEALNGTDSFDPEAWAQRQKELMGRSGGEEDDRQGELPL